MQTTIKLYWTRGKLRESMKEDSAITFTYKYDFIRFLARVKQIDVRL